MLLERNPGIEVVGQAGDGRAAIALARKQRSTVVIIDVAMHGMNGVEATRRMTAKVPGTKVLGLSLKIYIITPPPSFLCYNIYSMFRRQ